MLFQLLRIQKCCKVLRMTRKTPENNVHRKTREIRLRRFEGKEIVIALSPFSSLRRSHKKASEIKVGENLEGVD